MGESLSPVDLDLGARIRLRRKALSRTQAWLAETVELSIQKIQGCERGAVLLTAMQLVRIARALETTVAALHGRAATEAPAAGVFPLASLPNGADLARAYAALDDEWPGDDRPGSE